MLDLGGTPVIVSGGGLDEGWLSRLVEVDGRLQAKWWRRLPSALPEAFVTVSCASVDVLIATDGINRLAVDAPP